MGSKSIKYLIHEGFRSMWVNRMMSIASVAVLMSCLILIGSAFMVFVNINELVDRMEEQNVIMVFVEQKTTDEENNLVEADLKNMANIKDVKFVPKEEGLESVTANMSDANKAFFTETVDGDNPLPDGFKVTVKDMQQFEDTVQKIKQINHVETIRENRDLAQKLVTIQHGITVVAIAIIVILFAVSMFIISNTIKLTMYSRRLEINIMKSVGATDSFVKIPFVVEGIVLGVIAGLVSLAAVWAVYAFAVGQFGSLLGSLGMQTVKFTSYALPMLGIFILIGVASGTMGSLISMRKYLRKEGSEVSAL